MKKLVLKENLQMTKKQYERPIIIKQQSGLMNKFGSSTINNPITEIDGVEGVWQEVYTF